MLVDSRGDGTAVVRTDDCAGGRLAAEHLVQLGHRRIAFIGDDPGNSFGFTATADRERGFRDVLREAGIPVRPSHVVHGPHDHDVARRLTADLITAGDRPTAVFASSDVQAMGVLAAAAEAGLRVPEDLSVIGFDDIELSEYAGLTTVRQPLFDSGFLGARLLLDALDAGSLPPAATHELPLELVTRTTTAAPARGVA